MNWLFHAVGAGCVFAESLWGTSRFLIIAVAGKVSIVEPNLLILYGEVALSLFAVGYLGVLAVGEFRRLFGKRWRTEN